MIPKIKF